MAQLVNAFALIKECGLPDPAKPRPTVRKTSLLSQTMQRKPITLWTGTKLRSWHLIVHTRRDAGSENRYGFAPRRQGPSTETRGATSYHMCGMHC